MGYWIRKDSTTWSAMIHRDDLNDTSANCRWKGWKQGKPVPQNWEHVDKLPFPLGTIIVSSNANSKQVLLTPCAICMQNYS